MAELNVGRMYAEGRGITRNDAEAVRWYRVAAERNFADGAVSARAVSLQGRAYPDEGQALLSFAAPPTRICLWRSSSRRIGYLQGRGVVFDKAKGLQLVERAATGGNAEAQLRLAERYMTERRRA